MSNMNLSFGVPLVLTLLALISGGIALVDILYLSKKRRSSHKKQPIIIEYARSFFPVFLLVLLIRSFIIQPYRVPTGSLAPTILPGDFVVVSQYAYGLRLPVLNKKVFDIGEPKRGDIVLFRFPDDLTIYIKRVVGLPGDHIVYRDKILTVNNDIAWQVPLGMELDVEDGFSVPVQLRMEHLGSVIHKIFIRPGYQEWESIDLIVPPRSYFMMGDNRDNSGDSRKRGFVPEENLIGKAFGVWMSWDSEKYGIRWRRIGNKL